MAPQAVKLPPVNKLGGGQGGGRPVNYDFSNPFGGQPGSLPPIGRGGNLPPIGRGGYPQLQPPQAAPETNFNVQDNDNESQFRGSSRSKTKKFKKKVKKMKKMMVQERDDYADLDL